MRIAANFVLVVFFVTLSLVAILAGSLKFQLLDFNFWQQTFDKDNVYQNLAVASKNSLETQIGKEGGSKPDAKVLTDLITKENVKDFVNKNIQNVLSFVNGKSSQIIVYLPLRILPKNLLPRNLNGIQSEMPLGDLLTKFNYQNYSSLPLTNLSRAGTSATLAFTASVSLLFVILILFVLLIEKGSRFTAPGFALTLSGFLIISAAKIVESLKSLQSVTQGGGTSFVYTLAGILLPSLLGGLTRVWYMVGIVLVVLGLILFFVRKPGYNTSK